MIRPLLLATILLLLQRSAASGWDFGLPEDEDFWIGEMQETDSMSTEMPVGKPTQEPSATITNMPTIGKGSKGMKGNKGSKGDGILPGSVVETVSPTDNQGASTVPSGAATTGSKGSKGVMAVNGNPVPSPAGTAGSSGVASTVSKGSKGDKPIAVEDAVSSNVAAASGGGDGVPQVRKTSAVQAPETTDSSGDEIKSLDNWRMEEVLYICACCRRHLHRIVTHLISLIVFGRWDGSSSRQLLVTVDRRKGINHFLSTLFCDQEGKSTACKCDSMGTFRHTAHMYRVDAHPQL